MSLNTIEQQCLNKKKAGVSYAEIRSELESTGHSNEEIKSIIRSIDDIILHEEIHASNYKSRKELLYIGIILLLVGISITIGSYLYNYGHYYLISYGAIISGVSLIVKSRKI